MEDPIERIKEFYNATIKPNGTLFSGAVFGIGWWLFIDAMIASTTKVSFTQYLPGIVATIGLTLINTVRQDEIQGYDTWGDEGVYCRSRVWLLIAYLVCGAAALGSVVVMIHLSGAWLGLSCVLQVTCILAAALMFFTSRSGGEDGGGYEGF